MKSQTTLASLGLAVASFVSAIGVNSAEAVLIQRNGGTIFSDDFESAPTVVSNINADTSDADPVPLTGASWTVLEQQPHHGQVTSDAVNTAGAAFQGSNFLHSRVKPDGTGTTPAYQANFTSVTGGTLHFETMYRNAKIADGPTDLQFTLMNPNGTFSFFAGPILRADANDGLWKVFTNNVTVAASTGIPVAADQSWHRVEMDVNLSTGFYSATIDGVTSATFDSGVSNITTTGMDIGPADGSAPFNQRFDLDAVIPEPASLSVLALGGLLIGCQRVRRI